VVMAVGKAGEPADRDKLEQVTKSVYEQVDRTGAKRS